MPLKLSIYCKHLVCLFMLSVGNLSSALASDFKSPRADGLGGAGHASPLLGDAIFLNPSFLPYTQTHSLTFDYQLYGQGSVNTPSGPAPFYGHTMSISVTDGTPQALFQAGVAYTVREDVSLIHVAVAKQLIKNHLSLGVGTKFLVPNGRIGGDNVDGSLSVTSYINSWLQASLIVDNILGTIAPSRISFSREYILGLKFNVMGIVLAYLDPHLFSDLSFGYEAGAEFPFFTDFFLRIGGFSNSVIPYQAQRGSGYSIGLGWVGPKISFDYAFSRAFGPISALSHNMSASLFF